jgi:hypothetical protein
LQILKLMTDGMVVSEEGRCVSLDFLR